jgi:hypothetical protein
MLLEIGNKIATFSKITEMHREKKLEPCGPVRRNLREEKLKELRTRGGFGAMRFPYLAIRQAASQCSGVEISKNISRWTCSVLRGSLRAELRAAKS